MIESAGRIASRKIEDVDLAMPVDSRLVALGFHVDAQRNKHARPTRKPSKVASYKQQSRHGSGQQNESPRTPDNRLKMCRLTLPFFIALVCMTCTHVWGFSSLQSSATASRIRKIRRSSTSDTVNRRPTLLGATASDGKDPDEIIATRIVVTGDVNGGYYRSCVKNEVGRKTK